MRSIYMYIYIYISIGKCLPVYRVWLTMSIDTHLFVSTTNTTAVAAMFYWPGCKDLHTSSIP